jgi:hypothetical protein
MRCRPKINASHFGFNVEWGGDQRTLGFGQPIVPDFLCAIFPDEMIELLTTEAAKHAITPKLTLAPAERDAKLAELRELILRLERSEEQLIGQAENDYHHYVDRRPNAAPLAVLGLAIEKQHVTTKAAVA